MSSVYAFDENLVRRLPLPLAKLYRRAHNAREAFDRHQAAYFLWEASLKLLGSVAIVAYADHSAQDPKLAERLTNLARPSLGHWWEFVRQLVPVLADAGDEAFAPVRDLLFGRAPDNLKHAAALALSLRQELDGEGGGAGKWRISDLFERLVRYRNREIGHGAVGQRPRDFYERLGSPLLAGIADALGRLDVLAGRKLVYFAEVRQLKFGDWLIERDELMGEIPKRLEPLTWPRSESNLPPYPDCLYLELPAKPLASGTEARPAGRGIQSLRSLRPLVVYDANAAEVFFLNAQRGVQRLEYLCYTSACMVNREELLGEQRELMTRILGVPVDPSLAGQWAARAQAEEEKILAEDRGSPAPAETAKPEPIGNGFKPESTIVEPARDVVTAVPVNNQAPRKARKSRLLLTGGIAAAVVIAAILALIGLGSRTDHPRDRADSGKATQREAPPPPEKNDAPPSKGPEGERKQPDKAPPPEPELRTSLREMGAQVAKLLKGRNEDTIAVGAFTGPAHCPSSAGPGIKVILIEELEKLKVHVKTQANLELKGDYREVLDKGSDILVLRVKAEVLDREGEALAKLDQRIGDREMLAQVLGITKPDFGSGITPRQESAELYRCVTQPSVELLNTKIKASPSSRYAIEIEVKEANGYVPRNATKEDGLAFVALKKSDVFAINLINDSDYDAAVELSLDGLKMFAFSENRGYRYVLVPKHSSMLVKGWHRTNDVSDEFVITDHSKSAVAELLTNPDNIGTITAMFSAAWDPSGKPPEDEGAKFRDPFNPAVGRGQPVSTPYKDIVRQRGRVRDVISVRYKKPV
jgi:hypothetical protein